MTPNLIPQDELTQRLLVKTLAAMFRNAQQASNTLATAEALATNTEAEAVDIQSASPDRLGVIPQ